MTTAQPSAGTSLHSDWTTDLVFARNEAETDATVLAAGSATRTAVVFDVVFGTDADGRFKQYNPSVGHESWTGIAAGPEITILTVLKYASSGAIQAILDSDDGIARNWQFRQTTGGAAEFIGFDSGAGVDVNFASSATISASDDQAVIVRVRNDGGTYKAKVWVGPTATSEVSYSGTPASLTSGEDIGITERLAGGQAMSASKLYFSAIWNAALSDTDCDALAANPWAIYDAKSAGSTPIAFTGTIPTQTFTDGDSVDVDLSGYWSGTETPFSASSVGASFAALGLSINSSTFHLTGTAVEGEVTGCQIRGTDATPDTADSNTFTITVNAANSAPSWSGTPSAMSSKRGQALTPQDITSLVSDADLDTLSYSITGAPTGVTINSSTGVISGTPTAAPGVYACTVEADDGIASPVSSGSFNITVTQCVLALNSAGYEFGDGNDPATMSVVASTELQVAAYPLTEWPPASAIATATATTGTNGRLADLGDDDLSFGTTYRVIARNAADGETWAWTMAAS